MRVTISTDDTSRLAAQGIDIQRFLSHLANNDTIAGEPSPFDLVEVFTSWGLLVFRFGSPFGTITRAMNVAVLDITKDIVVKDDGTLVDRYEKVAEELCKTTLYKLQDKDTLKPVAHD